MELVALKFIYIIDLEGRMKSTIDPICNKLVIEKLGPLQPKSGVFGE